MDTWFQGSPMTFDAFVGNMSLWVQGSPYEESQVLQSNIAVDIYERLPRKIQLVPV